MQTTAKKSSKFTKKITHVDDMMIHNLVKILVQTRLCLWDIKITNFYKSSGHVSGLKFVILISHKQSRVWTKYFTRLYIIISSTCVIFSVNLDDFFAVVCTGFHEVMVCTRYVPYYNLLSLFGYGTGPIYTTWGSYPFILLNILMRRRAALSRRNYNLQP